MNNKMKTNTTKQHKSGERGSPVNACKGWGNLKYILGVASGSYILFVFLCQ